MFRSAAKTRLKSICLVSLAFILLIGFVGQPAEVDWSSSGLDSYIVQGANVDAVVELVEKHGGFVTSRLEIIHGVGALVPSGAVSTLLAETGITAITPNYPVEAVNAPGYGPFNAPADYPEVVGADLVWDEGITGAGVTVAVVDTGLGPHNGIKFNIDGKQQGRILGWANFVLNGNGLVDLNGHGTHVAGIIANTQKGSDGKWNGIAPGVSLVSARVLNDEGRGTYEQVINGIQWVVANKDLYNIRVMNLSLIAAVRTPYWADPLNQAVTYAWANGITVVAAAGNGGPDPMSIGVPGNNPYIITVGAYTDNYTIYDWTDDYITPFSSAGPTPDGFVKPDVVAPGAHMVSSMMAGTNLVKNGQVNYESQHYYSMAGTSQSAAVVSGIAALMIANKPSLTPDQVKFRIMYTALPWVDVETTEALYSIWQQGAGRVNAPDAVLGEMEGQANYGMDIWADLAGGHYAGYSYFDEETGTFRLRGDFSDWDGGYWAWDGGWGAWSGGWGAWSGGWGAWSGGVPPLNTTNAGIAITDWIEE
jgi:serine protease AprX